MKILYVSGTNVYSAGNRVLVSWIDYLLSHKNFDIYVASPSGGSLSIELKKRLSLSKLLFCNFSFFSPMPRNFLNFFKNFSKLLSFIYKIKPDIIHCNGEDVYLMMRYFAKIFSIPIVLHLRFHWSKTFYSWLFKKHFLPDLILTVSRALREEEIPKLKGLVATSKINVLPNCIDLNLVNNLSKKTFSFPLNSKYKFGVAAAIQERKGQVYGVKLASKLKNNLDFILYFAGRSKDNNYYRICLNEIESCPELKSSICFLGFVKEIFSFMKQCDLMYTFSSYETFGMTVLECMAVGTPLAGFSCPAIDEVLGCDYLTVPFGDIESLSTLTFEILDNENFRNKIKQHFNQRVRNFSPNKIVPKLISYYEMLL